MLKQLVYESEKVDLSINTTKTKAMTNSINIPITVHDNTIEYVKEFTYLG